MNRIHSAASLLLTAAAFSLASAGHPVSAATRDGSSRADETDRLPNIIVVLFDDMGWGQPPCYNSESKLRTPHLDKLASEGMRFTDAHSASAVCTPTRYGLLTGRYPSRIGQFGVLTTYSPPIIPRDRLTVASLLKSRGYETACIGKWHLGLNWADGKPGRQNKVPIGSRFTDGPTSLGFDYFYGFTHARNIETVLEQDVATAHTTPVASQPLMLEKALWWLRNRNTEKPCFLYFPMCPPHTPVVPSDAYKGKSGGVDEVGGNPEYADWVFQGDAMLGRIMQAIEEDGTAENTLLIATSDNGAEHRAYAPLRESKRSIYEGGHRVPFVARWPGIIDAGAVCDATICLNDIPATAADISGFDLPPDSAEDSFSLMPLFRGEPDSYQRLVTLHQSHKGDLALRAGALKAVYRRNGIAELFDLTEDISETSDLGSERPQDALRLRRILESLIAEGRSTPGPARKNDVRMRIP